MLKKTSVSLAAALAALTFAGTAHAQVCNGFPTMDRQFSIAGVANFPEDIDEFGAEASYNLAGPLGLNASYLHASADGGGSANTFVGGASFDVTSLIGPAPAVVSLCPTASFAYSDLGDDFTVYSLPIGLGFGTSLPMSGTTSLQPYVVPQIVFGKVKVGDVSSDWENDFGLRGGANLTFGQFFVGGEVNTLFADETNTTFGVKAGIRL